MFLELRHLRSIQAIHSSETLSKAAQRLHLTQSALSHQIKALEGYFGTPLFFRRTRPLRLTPAGETVLALAREVLPRTEAVEHRLRAAALGEHGRLNVAIECHSCFQWLMPTMDRFRAAWPAVELDLLQGHSFHPLPALVRGDMDLVVSSDPDPHLRGIHYAPLFRYEMRLAVANGSPLAERSFVEPADLEDQVLIAYPVCRDRLDVFSRFLGPADVEPREVRTTELTIMMMQLVAAGRGVATLPRWALDEYLARGYAAALPLGRHGLWSTLYAAVREEDRDRAYLRGFIADCRAVSMETLQGIHLLPETAPAP